MKKLTKRQWQSVYDSVCKSYMNSYAMMVDDALNGFKKFEKKYGLTAWYDGSVFSQVFYLVKQRGIGYELDNEDLEVLSERRKEDA